MERKAARRISRRGPGYGADRDVDTPEGRAGTFFPFLVVLSLIIHAAVLSFLVYFPGADGKHRDIKVFSVELTGLPGPMGGGGESPEVVKPPKEPVKTPPPEKEPVKVASKQVEKNNAEPRKPEEPVAEKVPEAPKGPGQGPVGGGGKKGTTRGPITLEGGVEFPFGFYLDALQQKVERNWDPPKLWMKNLPKVVIFFKVDRSGSVSDVNVETGSGIDLFDQKAVLAVKRSAPFPPLPGGFKGDRLGVHYIFIPEG